MKKIYKKPEGNFMKKMHLLCALIIIFSVIIGGVANTERGLAKALTLKDEIFMDANRISCAFYNNGIWGYNMTTSDWGVEWPKGSGLSPIYAAGEMFGARVNGEVRVAGVQHSATEWQPGKITAPGVADNPTSSEYRWYELKPGGAGDWTNWPKDQGATFNEDGSPKLIGQQTIFSVWNDLGTHGKYGTNKLGAEVQQTAFAFNRSDAIGDMIFVKWKIINKSVDNYDDAYFVIWSDPDVGDAGDDLVGSDSTLGLGYCYNGAPSDQNYGDKPPAMGIDFFQGPIIDSPGDTAKLPDGREFLNKKILNMTSFIYYNNDNTNQGNPDTGNDVYNYMRGFWRDGSPITNDGANGTTDGPKTKFMFSGDPETDDGWLDSNPADRRYMMTTGPFSMAPWIDENGNKQADLGEPGVQVIVAGVICAEGDDNLKSVTKLKEVDALAQLAYDLDFKLANAPPVPLVEISEKVNEVILTWDDASEFNKDGSPYSSTDPIIAKAYGDTVMMNNIEIVIDDSTYNFYGYTVYQYSTAGGADAVEIGHWDNKGQADAQPYEGPRHFVINVNKNSVVGPVGQELINGKEYYFGIAAEGYNEFGVPQVFQSSTVILTVVPRNNPGIRYANVAYGDTIDVVHARIDTTLPLSQGNVTALVVDPTKTTGHNYKVIFYKDTLEVPVWALYDITAQDTLLKDRKNQRNDDAYNVVDGILVKVSGAEPSILSCNQVDPTDWNTNLDENLINSLNFADDYRGGKPSFLVAADGAVEGDKDTQFARWDWRHNTTPNDIVIEFVENPETEGQIVFSAWADGPNSPNGDYLLSGWKESDTLGGEQVAKDYGRLPFRAWMITPSGERTQIIAGTIDDDEDWYWNQTRKGAYVDDALSGFERIYICNHPYDETEITSDGGATVVNDIFWGSLWDAGHSVGRVVFSMYFDSWSPGTGGIWGKPPASGTVVRWNSAKPNTANDYFTFTAPAAPTDSLKHQKSDLKIIKAVPNPYYGYHSGERSLFDRWVQFTNLPEKCTITIFDLAGNRVRILKKEDLNNPLMKWDIKNGYGLPVASGIYIYHVDAKGIGEKVGKLAIFAPDERLDTY